MIKWTAVYNKLQKLLDLPGECYFSGSRFIHAVQVFEPNLSSYRDYIEERNKVGRSTTRRDFFKDILTDLDEGTRVRAVSSILDELERVGTVTEEVSEIRKLLGSGTLAPTATIPAEAWNADRLNECLREIDSAIGTGDYERAVSLSYTCLEGFLGAFVRAKEKRDSYPNEIIALSKEVKDLLKKMIRDYPDEVLNGVTNAAYAVDRSRNRFSESHFANEAGSWLATYVRDVVNTQIRLLLHFM
jgi:hypothetical protein